jgi:hypothetical protein
VLQLEKMPSLQVIMTGLSKFTLVINLNLATNTIFANCSKARSGKMLLDNPLLDAEKV